MILPFALRAERLGTDEHDDGSRSVPQPREDLSHDAFGRGRGTWRQANHGSDALTHQRTGHGDGGGLGDARVQIQRVLHLEGGNVLAATDDEVLAPIADIEQLVFVETTNVAGVEPPVLVERLSGGLGVIDVVAHHILSTHENEADLASGQLFLRLWVHDLDLAHGDNPANAVGVVDVVLPCDCGVHSVCLRHPVPVHEHEVGPALLEIASERVGRRRAAI